MNFCLADESHDAGLRRLMRDHPMPGWIRLAFTCEPNWAGAHAVLGDEGQTIVGLDAGDAVVGCGVRTVRRAFVNGEPGRVGYLSGLRLRPEARAASALARGYRFLRELHHRDGAVAAYLTTIIESNRAAIDLLTSRRAGLPIYSDRGRIITSAIFFDRHRRARRVPAGLEIRTGEEVPLGEILAFLRKEGRRRPFFPAIGDGEIGTARWRGLHAAGFRVARRGGNIVGVAAAWDQSAFRQAVVASYAPALAVALPLLNSVLRVGGRRPLPKPGSTLPFFHVALPCVDGDDPDVFSALLDRIHDDWRQSAFSCFVLSLHERSPWRRVVAEYRPVDYASLLYLVYWPEDEARARALETNLVPHVESGLL